MWLDFLFNLKMTTLFCPLQIITMDFDGSADPAAEFLAREQDQLAGIGDDIIAGTEPVTAPAG